MANPPVCRIMDYGKFRYEEAQKAKEARKKSSNVTVKEVKFRPKIGKGDFDTKVRHLVEFIDEGHKVKVTLQFRGREMAHPELGRKVLDDVIAAVGVHAKVENQARMEGRSMSMVLSPDKKAMDAIKKAESSKVKAEQPARTDTEAAPAEQSTEIEVTGAPVEVAAEQLAEIQPAEIDLTEIPVDAAIDAEETPEEAGEQ
jgi:translation initiation factor IF-3